MKLTRFKQSCFLIEIAGKRIYIDPNGIPEGQNPADIILITHSHSDHYEKSSVENIFSENTTLIAPKSCSEIIDTWNGRPITPGEKFEIEGLSIEAVPAYNQGFIRRFLHNSKKHFCGYIISDGNSRIYHAGDTDLIPELKELENIDVLFLPVGGFFTMNSEDAINLIKNIQPKKFIPMHELRTDLEEFKQNASKELPETEIIILRERDECEIN
ncbi:MAG: MBL fold metallo-hydrolase [Candidatus Lokiarchaeota archaeon]